MALIEPDLRPDDAALMARAVARAAHARLLAPPDPWVGTVLVAPDGTSWEAASGRPGAERAEAVVLARAGARARGATLYLTLEPGPGAPAAALADAGVARVVVAVADPDPTRSGQGVEQLRGAGIEVRVGPGAAAVEAQLAPYLTHRRTGRPYVVLRAAATLDGRTGAADGTSGGLVGPEARADAMALRAESDAIAVGAGTVRRHDPRLTVRDLLAPDGAPVREPLRVVLGRAPAGAAVHPCLELDGEPAEVLAELGRQGVVQLLVESGPTVAGAFHRAGLIDRYVIHLAPALAGGDDGPGIFHGAGVASIGDLGRLRFAQVTQLGDDLRIELTRSV